MTTELTKTVEGMQDALVLDLKGIVVVADKLMNEVACATVADFTAARTKIAEQLGDAKARLDHARTTVTRQAACVAGATQEYARENPWQLMGVAAAAGIVIGFLLTRR